MELQNKIKYKYWAGMPTRFCAPSGATFKNVIQAVSDCISVLIVCDF